MKKVLYFLSWAVLTATDAILGYKTATTDFGIKDTILATVWALGFSLLSVPAKIIYDRLIEETYDRHPIIGKVIFTAFAGVWLFVAYNAYTGVSELRKKDMRREQLSSIKLDLPSEEVKAENTQVESQYDYRLAKAKMKIQAKQDSTKFAMAMAEQTKFRAEQMKLVGETDSKGFLYFNLLLILSASICLSLAFKDEPQKQAQEITIDCDIDHYTTENNKVDSKPLFEPNTESLIEEYTAEVEQAYEKLEKRNEANETPYRCESCDTVFRNRFAYNAHMRKHNTTCVKGNYTRLPIDFKPLNIPAL